MMGSFVKVLTNTFVVYDITMLRLADAVLIVLNIIVSSANHAKTVVNMRG